MIGVILIVRYYCSGYDINNAFGHGLGDMIKTELKNSKRIVYIVGDPKKPNKIEKAINVYVPSFRSSFEKNGIVFEDEKIILPSTNSEEAKNWIDESDFLMLMGGDPFDQKEMCENLGIVENIKNYQGVLMGYSAGAMLMSKYIIITPCSDEYPNFKIDNGLNLDGISIYPHNNTASNESPAVLDIGKEKYKKEDLIKVANEYGEYYLLQDYMNETGEWDISIVKASNGKIELYTENNGRIWNTTADGVDLVTPQLSKNIVK
jgi:peptidase E